MGSKIFWFLILVVLCVGGYYAYDRYHEEKLAGSGDVTWESGQPSPEERDRFAKENAGETPDGQSEHKIHTASEDAAAAATGTAVVGPAAKTEKTAGAEVAHDIREAKIDVEKDARAIESGAAPTNLPTSDSIPPNPTNGARFSGSGTYQWYRQGNLTWRVDTVSGRSCIDYATLEEWRKPIVSSHGCGRGA